MVVSPAPTLTCTHRCYRFGIYSLARTWGAPPRPGVDLWQRIAQAVVMKAEKQIIED